jgi:transposase InsO family protein
VSEKYRFTAEEYANNNTARVADAPTLTQMLTWLNVSKSGFYEWLNRPPSASEQRRETLKTKITALFDDSGATYGYRRIHAELIRSGEQVGDELVRTLMRELNLVPVQPKPYRTTTIRSRDQPDIPDLVQRDFTADRPGTKLLGDITYIPTWQGWLYLATIIDCFNKEIIGYAMTDHLRTKLATDALTMAARNHTLQPGCIMHTDRGTQYTSAEYTATLTKLGLRHSLGRTGVCWDNAPAESFFATLKNERVHHMAYPTRKQATDDIARYIELHYNRRRIHSTLGYQTPHEVRNNYLKTQTAA